MKKFLLGLSVSVLIIFSALGGAIADRLFVIKPLDQITGGEKEQIRKLEQKVVKEESVVIDVASKASPSVVTVSIQKERTVVEPLFKDPFGLFNVPGEQRSETIQRDIGTGFVIEDGLIVTNKHVVADSEAEYEVIDNEENRYQVTDIYRDPVNDLNVRIYNSLGVFIKEFDLKESSVEEFTIDMKSYPAGIYLVRVESSGNISEYKIIKTIVK